MSLSKGYIHPMYSSHIPSPAQKAQLEAVCRTWHITSLALFGSVLRDDFSKRSDVDVLISFADGAAPDLFLFIDLKEQLETIFGRKVDVVTRRAIERSHNTRRRDRILGSAKIIYEKAAA